MKGCINSNPKNSPNTNPKTMETAEARISMLKNPFALGIIFLRTKNKIRLVYAGSSTKFGEFNDGGEGENKSPYAYFKSTNTNLVNNYGEWFGLDYAITYFYNVFGEREIGEGKYATLIAIFTRKYKNGEVLSINAPGTQKRAFTYVKDIVRGLLLVEEKGKGDGYCIGSEKSYSILEIAEKFGSKIEMLSAKKGDRDYSKINLTKMKELGWSAEKDIMDYIIEIKNKFKKDL